MWEKTYSMIVLFKINYVARIISPCNTHRNIIFWQHILFYLFICFVFFNFFTGQCDLFPNRSSRGCRRILLLINNFPYFAGQVETHSLSVTHYCFGGWEFYPRNKLVSIVTGGRRRVTCIFHGGLKQTR